MSWGDILVTIVQLLGAGVVGYLTGLWQGRRQTQYQRRVEVVRELRRRLRELRAAFADMVTPPEWRLPEDAFEVEEVEEVGERLDALTNYFEDNASWLDQETRERLDKLTDEYAFRWAELRGLVDAGENPEMSIRAAWEWLGRAADEVEKINEGFSRVEGTHTPRWRRVFGS